MQDETVSAMFPSDACLICGTYPTFDPLAGDEAMRSQKSKASWAGYGHDTLRKIAIQGQADARAMAQDCAAILRKLDASEGRIVSLRQLLKLKLQAPASPAANLDEGIGRLLEKRQVADPAAAAVASSPMFKAVAEGVAALAKRVSGLDALDKLAPYTSEWKQ